MTNAPTELGPAAITADLPDEAEEKSGLATTAGVRTASFLSENPVALALVGVSAGWLALLMSRQGRDVVSEYPRTTGVLAVATGVGIALALPETQVENQLIRPVARSVAGQARGLVEHVKADIRTAREAVGALRDSLSSSAQSEG
jgi:hypothetical protein